MKRGGEQIYVLFSSMKRAGRQDRTHLAQCINLYGHMTGSLSLSYIPLYMHVRLRYIENLADLQGTRKLYLRCYNKISRLHKPCNENWHAHFLCVYAVYSLIFNK